MREHYGELWDLWSEKNWLCITTNGYVRRNGSCVMGKGCALEAARRWPEVPKLVGTHILVQGNTPMYLPKQRLITFPVKHNWWEQASLELIKESGVWLLGTAILDPEVSFFLPRPGVGNGKRDWKTEVKPLLECLELPDNVVIVTK